MYFWGSDKYMNTSAALESVWHQGGSQEQAMKLGWARNYGGQVGYHPGLMWCVTQFVSHQMKMRMKWKWILVTGQTLNIPFSPVQWTANHLEQGTIGQLSEVFDKYRDKLTIFEPFMSLEQTYGSIFILTVCLPIVQRWHTNVNKFLLLFLKCILRYIQRTKCC